MQLSFWADAASGLREMLVVVSEDDYAKLTRVVAYTIKPLNAVGDYQWKVKDGLTICREESQTAR